MWCDYYYYNRKKDQINICLRLLQRYESMAVVWSKRSGCKVPAPKPVSLSVEKK